MRRSIWKFNLPLAREGRGLTCEAMIPRGARVLDVQIQRGEIRLWALVDPAAEPVRRLILVIGTGWDLDAGIEACQYLSTIQDADLIWHIFLEPEPRVVERDPHVAAGR